MSLQLSFMNLDVLTANTHHLQFINYIVTIRILVFLNCISSTAHTGMGDATVILLCVANANTNNISNRIILLVLLMLKHNSINTKK